MRPGLDDKVLADWNGLMIAALANASARLERAVVARPGGARFRFRRRRDDAAATGSATPGATGKLKFPGLASDFAAMIRAALALHEATGEQSISIAHWPGSARLIATTPMPKPARTTSPPPMPKGLVVRPAATTDDATPNHNAVAAQNLVRLAVLAGDDDWREKADRLIAAVAPLAVENLFMHMALLNAIDLRLRAAQIVVTGEGARAEALLAAARGRPHLDRIVLHARSADALPASHPARAKIMAANEPQAFVCVGEACSLPVTDPSGLTGAIDAVRHT